MIHRLFFLLLLLVLQACVSSEPPPQTFYYVLEEKPLVYEWEQDSQEAMIKIAGLPSYLLQPNLVMLEDNHQLYYANYHKWANDVRENIQHVLLADLNSETNQTNFVKSCKNCIEISIFILSFYPNENGTVFLNGYFEVNSDVSNIAGKTHLQRQSFAVTAPIMTPNYKGAVSAMRECVNKLSKLIVKGKV